jgi:hypothetical protein
VAEPGARPPEEEAAAAAVAVVVVVVVAGAACAAAAAARKRRRGEIRAVEVTLAARVALVRGGCGRARGRKGRGALPGPVVRDDDDDDALQLAPEWCAAMRCAMLDGLLVIDEVVSSRGSNLKIGRGLGRGRERGDEKRRGERRGEREEREEESRSSAPLLPHAAHPHARSQRTNTCTPTAPITLCS